MKTDRLTAMLNVRVTAPEMAALEETAAEYETTVASIVRSCVRHSLPELRELVGLDVGPNGPMDLGEDLPEA